MSVRTIVIDDELYARLELTRLLKKYGNIEVIAEAKDADEAQKLIIDLRPDLIFLDITMPGKDVFEMLTQLEYTPAIIFVTAYDQYAVKAFEANALDYLLKPLHPEKLKKAIDKIPQQQAFQRDGTRVFIKEGDNYHLIILENIIMVESLHEKTILHFEGKVISTKYTLSYFEQKLPPNLFFKANRTQLINLSFVKNISNNYKDSLTINLDCNLSVETSQRQTIKFKELHNL